MARLVRAKRRSKVLSDHNRINKTTRDLELYKEEIRHMTETLDQIVRQHSGVRYEHSVAAEILQEIMLANETLHSVSSKLNKRR